MNNLNDIYISVVQNGEITDEIIDFFKEVDGMCSTGTMAWMVNLCQKAVDAMEHGLVMRYNGTELNDNGFKDLLNANLSDYVIERIYKH